MHLVKPKATCPPCSQLQTGVIRKVFDFQKNLGFFDHVLSFHWILGHQEGFGNDPEAYGFVLSSYYPILSHVDLFQIQINDFRRIEHRENDMAACGNPCLWMLLPRGSGFTKPFQSFLNGNDFPQWTSKIFGTDIETNKEAPASRWIKKLGNPKSL